MARDGSVALGSKPQLFAALHPTRNYRVAIHRALIREGVPCSCLPGEHGQVGAYIVLLPCGINSAQRQWWRGRGIVPRDQSSSQQKGEKTTENQLSTWNASRALAAVTPETITQNPTSTSIQSHLQVEGKHLLLCTRTSASGSKLAQL